MFRCFAGVILKRKQVICQGSCLTSASFLPEQFMSMRCWLRGNFAVFYSFLNNRQHQLRISLISSLHQKNEITMKLSMGLMHSTRSYFLDRKLDLSLNSFKTKAAEFCKVLHKLFTARGSNDRQTFDWMNSIKFNHIQSWSLCQTLNLSNAKRMHQCLVVILPIEKNKLLKFSAQRLLMSSSS